MTYTIHKNIMRGPIEQNKRTASYNDGIILHAVALSSAMFRSVTARITFAFFKRNYRPELFKQCCTMYDHNNEQDGMACFLLSLCVSFSTCPYHPCRPFLPYRPYRPLASVVPP